MLTDTDGDGLGDCMEALDMNGNELVNAADGTLAYQVSFGTIIGDWLFDVNGNGLINAADGTLIRQAALGGRACI
jgi:hypothetical protein